jgi:hypothetical protein
MKNSFQRQPTNPVVMTVQSVILLYLSFTGLRASTNTLNAVTSVDPNGYGSPIHLANLGNPAVKESSGIAASHFNTNILWTHNDSGDGPFVYAFDRQGKHRGVWRVTGAQAVDWEDMAIGPGPRKGQSYLYLADIGDNSRNRDYITVYRVSEPRITPKDSSSTVQNPLGTELADAIRLRYPDGKHDAESLMIHPSTGDLYIVTKVRGAAAGVYKLKAPLPVTGVSTLVRIGEVRLPDLTVGWFTGGDISPDGRRVVMCDYLGAGEFILPNRRDIGFDEIWKQVPLPVDIGDYRGIRRQGEAICYRADGRALLATSEGSPCPLIEAVQHSQDR